MYRAWPKMIGGAEVCPVQLPGRENRMREPAYQTYQEMADGLADGLLPYLDRPFGFFGHCGAALAALETTIRLAERGAPTPSRLFVSSQVAPHDPQYGRMLTLTETELRDELVNLLIGLGANPIPDLVDMTLEILIQDMDATKAYALDEPVPVPSAITAIGWTQDFDVPARLMTGWPAYGPGTFELLPGVHYAFLEAPEVLQEVIRRDLCVA